MSAARTAVLLVGAASLTAGLSVAAMAPASATVCNIDVNSITSRELQDSTNNAPDEIKFDLGDDRYGTFTFPLNWRRDASLGNPNENFTSTVRFTLYEYDGVLRSEIDTFVVGCSPTTSTLELEGNGALYEVNFTVRD